LSGGPLPRSERVSRTRPGDHRRLADRRSCPVRACAEITACDFVLYMFLSEFLRASIGTGAGPGAPARAQRRSARPSTRRWAGRDQERWYQAITMMEHAMGEQELTELFRKLGADDPAGWARSQIREGIPQLARYLFLRQAWRQVLGPDDHSRNAQERAKAD